MHKVLVNGLGGLSLPRKSVVRLTDRPDMTLDVYRRSKTTMQQPLATDHILMQPKLSLRQWSPKHVYTSVGLQTLSKEIQRIQMHHFAVIQHIYLLSLPSVEELNEACDSILSLKV